MYAFALSLMLILVFISIGFLICDFFLRASAEPSKSSRLADSKPGFTLSVAVVPGMTLDQVIGLLGKPFSRKEERVAQSFRTTLEYRAPKVRVILVDDLVEAVAVGDTRR